MQLYCCISKTLGVVSLVIFYQNNSRWRDGGCLGTFLNELHSSTREIPGHILWAVSRDYINHGDKKASYEMLLRRGVEATENCLYLSG